MKIFVDSVKIFTSTKNIVKQAHVPWSATVTVGKFSEKDAEFFSGVMDEFYIFKTPLMHAEVVSLMSKCEFPSDSMYISSYSWPLLLARCSSYTPTTLFFLLAYPRTYKQIHTPTVVQGGGGGGAGWNLSPEISISCSILKRFYL